MKTLLRIFIKLLLGLTVAAALITMIIMFLEHLPESSKVDEFKKKQEAYEEIHQTLRKVLKEKGREQMVFYFDAETHSINDGIEGGEVFYTGEAVDKLMKFGTSSFDRVQVYEDKTIFSYGMGYLAIVYLDNGRNPGSFKERFVDFTTKSYKVSGKWYYTVHIME